MTRIAIIADDLTGALDSAAPFAVRGLRTIVATRPSAVTEALAAGCDVVAVSLNSRLAEPDEAVRRAAAAAVALRAVPAWFKKVDSRLKGHVSAEIGAVQDVRPAGKVVLCPAIPEIGRVVLGARVTGFGVGTPIQIACPDIPAAVLSVPDAASDADLDVIVAGAGPDTLFAGARGLATAVARRLSGRADAGPLLSGLPAPVHMLIGSRDPITLAQMAELRMRRPEIAVAPAPNGQVPAEIVAETRVLQVGEAAPPLPGAEVTDALVSGFLGHALHRCGTLVVTGGETASALLDRLAVGLLRVEGEVLPGLPLATFEGGPVLVTKSGGFGARDALLRLLEAEAV